MSFGRKWKNWGTYTPKLEVGDVVCVHGWVMLKGLEDGECYRVLRRDAQSYTFARPRGKKPIVRHYITSVDRWLRPAGHGDLNRIEVQSSFAGFGAAKMTKEEAVREFKETVLPYVIEQYGPNDRPAIREAWNDWTDMLARDGRITMKQYETWVGPFRGFGASKPSAHQEVFTLEELAKWFDLPDYMDVVEHNQAFLADYYTAAFEKALNDGDSEEEAEEAGMEAEQRAEEEEVYWKYRNGITAAAEAVLEPHELELKELGKGQYKIVPEKTWKDAAARLVTTINGVGTFYYEDAKELKDVGPYKSYKQAVLSHLHWALYYPEVYGTGSPQRAYEDAWRY